MRTITSDELRSIQLDLLQKTADFCEANGIRYFLCGGTLLGAIRHKGYIPWDDDIDIAMPRTDYDRFCMTFNQPNSKYRVKSLSTHPDYNNAFAKVYDDRTMLKELHYKGIHFGVYIDVLPVDGVKDSAQIKKISIKCLLLHYMQDSPKWKKQMLYRGQRHGCVYALCSEGPHTRFNLCCCHLEILNTV
jgi:lipopolysaccharide cholinephosphotransferase